MLKQNQSCREARSSDINNASRQGNKRGHIKTWRNFWENKNFSRKLYQTLRWEIFYKNNFMFKIICPVMCLFNCTGEIYFCQTFQYMARQCLVSGCYFEPCKCFLINLRVLRKYVPSLHVGALWSYYQYLLITCEHYEVLHFSVIFFRNQRFVLLNFFPFSNCHVSEILSNLASCKLYFFYTVTVFVVKFDLSCFR